MKIGGFLVSTKNLGTAAVGVYVCGIVLGLISVFWTWVNGGDFPRLEWWQFVLAPFGIGAAAIVLEAAGTFVLGGFTFEKTASKERVRAGEVVFVVLLIALLVGWPMYRMSRQ